MKTIWRRTKELQNAMRFRGRGDAVSLTTNKIRAHGEVNIVDHSQALQWDNMENERCQKVKKVYTCSATKLLHNILAIALLRGGVPTANGGCTTNAT